MTIEIFSSSNDISLADFSKLNMSSGYLGGQSTLLDVNLYAQSQTIGIIDEHSIADSSLLHFKKIPQINVPHIDESLISAAPALQTVNFTTHIDYNALLANLSQKNFWSNPLAFFNTDTRILHRPEAESARTETALANSSQNTDGSRVLKTINVPHSDSQGGIGGSGGNDPPKKNISDWCSGHYVPLNHEAILAILQFIFMCNATQIESNRALELVFAFPKFRLYVERRNGRVEYDIDTIIHQRSQEVGGNKHIIRIRSHEFNRYAIYVRRGESSFFTLETRENHIAGVHNLFAGGGYSQKSTSLGSRASSSLGSRASSRVIVVQPAAPQVQPAAPQVQPAVQAEIQAVAQPETTTEADSAIPEEIQSVRQSNSLHNFLITTATAFGVAQGVYRLFNRQVENNNHRIHGDGLLRGRRDFYNLTQAQGFEIFGINIGGVPSSSPVEVPKMDSQNSNSFQYYQGVRDGLEQTQYQYENSNPRHASRMRRVVNAHRATLNPPTQGNQAIDYNFWLGLASVLMGCYNSQNGNFDFNTIFRNIRRRDNN